MIYILLAVMGMVIFLNRKKVVINNDSIEYKSKKTVTDLIEQRVLELIEKNIDTICLFSSAISKVDFGKFIPVFTFQEAHDFEIDPKNKTMFNPSSEIFLKFTGMAAFTTYREILTEYFNKIVKNENREEFMFDSTTLFADDWIKRISRKKDADLWIALHSEMLSMIIMTNDSRVASIKRERQEKDEETLKENDLKKELFFKNFINLNEEFINNFLKHTKHQEEKTDDYGLRDKLIFERKLDGFIDKLISNWSYGYESAPSTTGWFYDFKSDLKENIVNRYSKWT